MKDERLVSKMEGKTNFLRRLKQFDDDLDPLVQNDLRHGRIG